MQFFDFTKPTMSENKHGKPKPTDQTDPNDGFPYIEAIVYTEFHPIVK